MKPFMKICGPITLSIHRSLPCNTWMTIAATNKDYCQVGTQDLLGILGALEFQVSVKKAQICQKEVTYLGYILKGRQRWLSEA